MNRPLALMRIKQKTILLSLTGLLNLSACLPELSDKAGWRAEDTVPFLTLPAAPNPAQQVIDTGLGGQGKIALQLKMPAPGFRIQSQCTLDEHLKSLQFFLLNGSTSLGVPPTKDLGDLSALAMPDANTFYVYPVSAATSPAETFNLVFENVPPGTYYIAAAAHNTDDASHLNISLASPPYLPVYGRINGHVVAISHTGGESANPGRVLVDNDYQVTDTAMLGLTLQLGNACPISNALGMSFQYIEPGSFQMGGVGVAGAEPVHTVNLTRSFYLQHTEVTQKQWFDVMGGWPPANPPSSGVGDNYPMHNVSWNDIQTFLSTLNGLGQGTYRLPTAAEWEYAARAGTTTEYSCGALSASCPNDYAWTTANAGGNSRPVATRLPNPWGLYDMHGNIFEWTADWYQSYTAATKTDPVPNPSTTKVVRGGAYAFAQATARSASLNNYDPNTRNNRNGFRLVRVN